MDGNVNATWEAYTYLALFIIVFAMGVVYQRRQRAKDALNNYVRF